MCCYGIDLGARFHQSEQSIWRIWTNKSEPLCCRFRLVRCPHWACDEQISVTNLTSHVLSSECGDNYMSNPLPYQEEIEYTRALDDHDGRSFWRPSLLQFENITFYLQVEKMDKQWYFYVQMEVS